ncbi:hypothetical protein CAOG_02324 [Capsaspora owczarzaki ATCC 30864]|uniref:Dynactin subunit 2 n=1 Tax=Capsaspora owczarzaki (strain ATCC 30864) TaxID=595528 RepID=A0A0D2WL27_CAPO3|nr:hypothetical protein CAOG_02324 [Capsaspora owczarzaki ATCC 30864]KJE91145.1 hypothetical protein CAOG_002324 [Capsaspora owczarzaki ATCC 30864]|eukprot:XP_004349074.1 hypothetical protein CAOG_02324 [Capsaspora owczarzaki ATCC 30864]
MATTSAKYANLSGLDTGPEIYEIVAKPAASKQQQSATAASAVSAASSPTATATASGLPGGSGAQRLDETESLDVAAAFKRFQQSSQSQAQAQAHQGGSSQFVDSLRSAGASASERLQRLQAETQALLADLAAIDAEQKAFQAAPKPDAQSEQAPLLAQARALQQQLDHVRLSKTLGTMAAETSDAERIVKQLTSLKPNAAAAAANAPADATGNNNGVVYELYYSQPLAELQKASKSHELERRLAALEATLGNQAKTLVSSAAVDVGLDATASLPTLIAGLARRVALLDPARLEQAERKGASLLQVLETAASKKQSLEDADKNNKIHELYQTVMKWDSVVDSVPSVVERLRALRTLHEQCASFSQSLIQLQASDLDIGKQLTSQQAALAKLDTAFAENMNIVQENSAALVQRIQSLNDRISKLSP